MTNKRLPEESMLCKGGDEELIKKKSKDLRKIRYQDSKLLSVINSLKQSKKD